MAWSEAARKASIEARRKRAKNRSSPQASSKHLGDLYRKSAVVKDLAGIRKKGAYLEDMIDAVRHKFGKKVFTYESAGMFGGIPTAMVGTRTSQRWTQVRDYLRKQGLSR